MLDRKNDFSKNRCKDYSKRRNYSAMSLSAAFFLLITWFCAVVDGQLNSYWESAFRGSYCGSRSAGNQCCQGRSDECTVPYFGTVCYCDAFCNRTHSPGYQDCCPDYPSICLGLPDNIIEPTKQCYFNGRFIKENEIHKINCNECKCELKGNSMALMCDSQECLINPTTMTLVNNQWNKYGWRARNYSEFWGRRLTEGIASRLGTILSAKKVLRMNAIGLDYDANRLPLSFDARKKWRGLIELPRDQGWCGASWAISTVAVISDRMKIQFPSHHAPLSPQHLLSCNTRNQPEPGCNGGHLTRAWIFIRRFGLVQEQCFPWVGHRTQCVIPKRKAANESRCVSPQMHRSPLYRVAPVYRIAGERDIMYEIQRSGPVQATMRVHPDFFMYEGGVYKCTDLSKEQRTGFHSVRIIGWGEEYQNGQTVKYWIVANSWGLSWGEQGYFRIRRGNNDCKIEDFVLGAWATEDKTPSINFKNKANIDNRLSNVI